MIYFKKFGQGKQQIILLHGWGGSWRSWLPVIERLKESFVVYAVDLPGFGGSPLPRPYGLADYVKSLEEFFDKEKILKPVLVGHSFGGQIAGLFASEKPKKISGLVLVDAAIIRDNSFPVRFQIFFSGLGKKMILSSPLRLFYPFLRKTYYRLRTGLGLAGEDYFSATNDKILSETLAIILREDLGEKIENISCPVLIFWGGKDTVTSPAMAEKMAGKIRRAKVVIIPEAGHFSYLDGREEFCEEIKNFIDSLEGSNPKGIDP
ncbi:MAG: alpha/beta hydrolase [bacterium]|nr:alpha/beta hydrolase [bacterium]